MQAVVVHPGTTGEALRSRGASIHLKPGRLGSVLLPSRTLTAAQRIAIYREMYPLRMREALASDYPGIEHFLADRFWDFVVNYTRSHPSRAYTLNRLGDHVPAFLSRRSTLKHREFLKDLAILELAITQAFDSPESGVLQAQSLEAIPPDRLGRYRLVTVPSLRLVRLSWNAADYLDTVRDEDHRHPKPRRAPTLLAVVRRNYSVYRFPVDEGAFAVLRDLKEGMEIEKVVQRALGRRGNRRARPDDFAAWFRRWTSEGLFSGVKPAIQAAPRRAKRSMKKRRPENHLRQPGV